MKPSESEHAKTLKVLTWPQKALQDWRILSWHIIAGLDEKGQRQLSIIGLRRVVPGKRLICHLVVLNHDNGSAIEHPTISAGAAQTALKENIGAVQC